MPDPYAEHWSPYLAMRNCPTTTIDPDGGLTTGPGDGDLVGTLKEIAGTLCIWDGVDWVTVLAEVQIVEPRMTRREMWLLDAIMAQDAIRGPTINGMMPNEVYRERGFGLVVWSSGAGWTSEGSYRGGTDPAAEAIDIFLWLAASPSDGKIRTRGEEQHGIGTKPLNSGQVHPKPKIVSDTIGETPWGWNQLTNDGIPIWKKYYEISDGKDTTLNLERRVQMGKPK